MAGHVPGRLDRPCVGVLGGWLAWGEAVSVGEGRGEDSFILSEIKLREKKKKTKKKYKKR